MITTCLLNSRVQINTYGKSILKNSLECFKISTGKGSKPVVILMAGLRPMCTASQDIIIEIIDQLRLKKSDEASFLLEIFDFWFFPITNPDGYDLGNTWANAAGIDLTKEESPSINLHAETFFLIKKIKSIEQFSKIEAVINLSDNFFR